MSHIRLCFIAVLFLVPAIAAAAHPKTTQKDPKASISGTITVGNQNIDVSADGAIKVRIKNGTLSSPNDSLAIIPDGPTDLYIDPRLLSGQGQPVFGNARRINPFATGPRSETLEFLNHLGVFFSTASGGFGFRINYDRKLSQNVRLIASPEFLTYGLRKAHSILGDQMPEATTQISLISIPFGLQQHFSPKSRLNPYLGFGAGPLLRLDHRSPRPGYYGYAPGVHGSFGTDRSSVGLSIPYYLDDFPKMSITLGGHFASGLQVKLGAKKDISLTIEGRYTLARFIESAGAPGDFSGYALAVGFGKAF